MLSLGISLCLLGLLLALYAAFFHSKPTSYQAKRLVTRNRVSLAFPMPLYYRDKIRSVPGVSEVGMSQWFGGTYKDNRDPNNFFARFAVEPDKLFTLRGEMQVSEDQKKAFVNERTACLLGGPLARRFNLKPGDRINLVGDIFPVNLEFTIRGIFEADNNDEVLYFHWKYLEESISPGRRSNIGTFNILARSEDDVPRIASAVDAMFHNAPVQTKTESEEQFGLSFLSFLGNVKAFLLSICAAVTFTILLVSANTMAMSVRERAREVGILKTLGFTTGEILGIILGEAVMISVAGGILGLGLAYVLCGAARRGPIAFDQVRHLSLQPEVGLLCLGIAAAVGLISAFAPAYAAARTPIVEAVRNAG
ncbi:MAG TPA: FtsX-like permease family protein [Bryobacteraceae bacterium]